MENGGADVACQSGEIFIALKLDAGPPFLGAILCQCRLRCDPARDPQRLDRNLSILIGAQVIRYDCRRVVKSG
jgi:hypothetical protein